MGNGAETGWNNDDAVPVTYRERWLIAGLVLALVISAILAIALVVAARTDEPVASPPTSAAPTPSETGVTTTVASDGTTTIVPTSTTVAETTTTVADTTTTTSSSTTTTVVEAPVPLGAVEFFEFDGEGQLVLFNDATDDALAVVPGDGLAFTLTEIVAPSPFFVAVYSLDESGQLGSVIGQSELQAAGVRRFIPVSLDVAVEQPFEALIVVHIDVDGDGQLTLPGPDVAGQFGDGQAAFLRVLLAIIE